MARLQDSPIEIILIIANYLRRRSPDPPIDRWLCSNKKDLNNLARTCRQLHDSVSAELYAYIPFMSGAAMEKLIRSIERDPALAGHVKEASVDFAVDCNPSQFFRYNFPALHTLNLQVPGGGSLRQHIKEERSMCLNLRTLRLCGPTAMDPDVTALLQMPRALEEFWYDAAYGPALQNLPDWEPIMEQALGHQKHSLRRLVFTAPHCYAPIHYTSSKLDISHLTNLRSLTANHDVVAMRDRPDPPITTRLPRSLEELSIIYTSAHRFHYPAGGDSAWLAHLLDQSPKTKHPPVQLALPSLQRVRILSGHEHDGARLVRSLHELTQQERWAYEAHLGVLVGESRSTTEVREMGAGPRGVHMAWSRAEEVIYGWRPPAHWVEGFERAGLSFSILLGYGFRVRRVVGGGRGFRDEEMDEFNPYYDSWGRL